MKPTLKATKVAKKSKGSFGGALVGNKLLDKIGNDKNFRDKCLTCYANRILVRTGKVHDITCKGIFKGKNKDGKPMKYAKLAFDGVESKSRYIAFPCRDEESKELVGAFKSIGPAKD